MPEPLTDEERLTVKAAAFGAVFLVVNAEPGVLSMIRESFAASRAIADSTGLVKVVLTSGALPDLPDGPLERTAEVVLPALRRAVDILAVKAPDEVENYRSTVVTAIVEVAEAVSGVTPAEASMIHEVRAALGVPA
ncbi:MAG TPA: hypothetical protein VGD43_10085 [Micromonospora sp.]